MENIKLRRQPKFGRVEWIVWETQKIVAILPSQLVAFYLGTIEKVINLN